MTVSLKTFDSTTDYDAPLLRLLLKQPDAQAKPVDVRQHFEVEYGQLIPETHREIYKDGKPKWERALSWAAYRLRQRSMLDSEPGVWRVTEIGRRWSEDNPDAAKLPSLQQRRPRRKASPSTTQGPGVTLEMLELTRKVMPSEQFRQVWGSLYDRLLAEERAQAITSVSKTELGRRTRQRLDEIHAFLRGENTGTPSSETVCDWIHFCYALQLYREAAALLQYAREDEVDPAIYKRAKRIAEVCRSKLAG